MKSIAVWVKVGCTPRPRCNAAGNTPGPCAGAGCRWISRGALLASILLVALCAPGWAVAQALSGRTVVDALEQLRGADLQFIYSSDLLTGSERVRAEPRAADPLGKAREILAGYQLGLRPLRPGLYAIVRLPAKPFVVRGRVFDRASGQSIRSARIELLPSGAVKWSGGQGEFAIEVPRAGAYTLRVSAQNYSAADIDAGTPGVASLDVGLEPAAPELAEIIVAASRYAVGESPSIGSFLLDGAQLAAEPSFGDDSIRALAHLPGMSQSGYSAQSNVRGGEVNEVLLLLDGFPLRQPFHLPGYHSFFSVLDPALIDTAEIYTGGFPVRYGNRLSGVFDLHTVNVGAEPQSALGVSFFNATARQSGPLGAADGDWLAVARVGTLKPLLSVFAPDTGDPSYSDVYARASYGSADRVKLTGNILWARDELNITADESGERAEIESRSRYMWLRADREFSPGLAASVWLGHSLIDSVRHGSVAHPDIATGAVSDTRASKLWDLRSHVTWQPLERHWLEGGAEWTRETADYRYRAAVEYTPEIAALFARDAAFTRLADLAPERDRVALFAAHRWRVTDAITSETGLRAQRILTKGSDREWIFDPRLSLRWQLSPATSLRAHWGRFHQADEIQELKVEDGLLNFPHAQRAEHFIGGIEHQLANGVAIRLEAFSKNQSTPRPRFENTLNPLALLPELAPDRVEVAPSSSESRGVELSAAYARRAWTGWTSLTWSKVDDEVAGREFARSWDQTWALTAGLRWNRGPWQVGAVASVHRGWPTTLLITDADGQRLAERNAARLPIYGTLDTRAAYQRALASGRITLAFEMTNLFNRRNACCSQLTVTPGGDRSTTFGTEQLNWLPAVPSLSVLWEF